MAIKIMHNFGNIFEITNMILKKITLTEMISRN